VTKNIKLFCEFVEEADLMNNKILDLQLVEFFLTGNGRGGIWKDQVGVIMLEEGDN